MIPGAPPIDPEAVAIGTGFGGIFGKVIRNQDAGDALDDMQATYDRIKRPGSAAPAPVAPQEDAGSVTFTPGTPVQESDPYETKLSPKKEAAFAQWKAKYAPNDLGTDYDLRGAFSAGLKPSPKNGHWPDTYKKPNHETFSVESKYAVGEDRARAGHWEGDTFVTPDGQRIEGK